MSKGKGRVISNFTSNHIIISSQSTNLRSRGNVRIQIVTVESVSFPLLICFSYPYRE